MSLNYDLLAGGKVFWAMHVPSLCHPLWEPAVAGRTVVAVDSEYPTRLWIKIPFVVLRLIEKTPFCACGWERSGRDICMGTPSL